MSPRSPWRQREFPFLHRVRGLERAFKVTIAATTALVLAGLIFGTSTGRRLTGRRCGRSSGRPGSTRHQP